MSGDFWSRRKAAVAAEAAADREAHAEAEVAVARTAMEERPDSEILAELGLKDPGLLEPGDDFAAYLQAAVPERLRRRALRRLWRSNPVLANLDGLVDHDEDYTDAATVVPDLQTAYQVGKGMLEHVLRIASAATDDATRDPNAELDGAAEGAGAAAQVLASGVENEGEAEPAPATGEPVLAFAEGPPPDPLPPLRRMRFDFTDTRGTETE